MRPVPAFSLHTLGRTVRVLHEPGVAEEFLAGLRSSWADCLLPEPAACPGSAASVLDAAPEGAPAVRMLLSAEDAANSGSACGTDRAGGPSDAAPNPAPGTASGNVPDTAPEDARDAVPDDVSESSPEAPHRVPVGEREGWAAVSKRFTSELTVALIRAHLAEESPDRPHLLHAAALMDPETGACAVLVGPSGRGKTTAAYALGRAGLVYLTDETSAIHPRTLRLTPYPKPLSVIREPGRPKDQIAASALGLPLPRDRPVPYLAALVVLDRIQDGAEDDGAAEGLPRAQPTPLHLGLQALAEQSSGTALRPDGLERLAALADRAGGILAVRYREAQTLAPLVRELLGRPAAPADRSAPHGGGNTAAEPGPEKHGPGENGPEPTRSWTYHPPLEPVDGVAAAGHRVAEPLGAERGAEAGDPAPTGRPADDGALAPALRWQRDPRTSAVDTADGMILLRGERSVTVSRVAADAWLRAADPVDSAALALHLERRHGSAPDGAFTALLDALAGEGLLRPVPPLPSDEATSSPAVTTGSTASRTAPTPAEKDR